MEVTDMKGLLLNNTLYSGAELARNFSISDELASAAQSQLGLSDIGAAKLLISSVANTIKSATAVKLNSATI